MNNDLLIIQGQKAYRCVDYRCGKAGETFLPWRGPLWTLEHDSNHERHILEEVPSPYILREDAEAVFAAGKHLDQTLARSGALGNNLYGSWQNFAAALAPFTQPIQAERFYSANRSQIEDTKHHTFHIVPTGLDTTKVAAAFNELTKGDQA